MGTIILLLLAGYLSGSLVWGYWISRLKGCDVRRYGSGNIGATNVYRVLGKGPGAITLVLDILKGALPVILTRKFFPSLPPTVLLGVGAAAVAGSMFPVFLRFKGGKGVNTTFGVIIALFPLSALSSLGVWIVIFFSFGIVSLASLTAAFSLIFWIAFFQKNLLYTGAGILIFLLIVWTHRSNIQRIITGKESRIFLWKKFRS